jgi:hypothetical protein
MKYGWNVIAPLQPTIHIHANGAAHHAALEQLVGGKGEHPLCGMQGG